MPQQAARDPWLDALDAVQEAPPADPWLSALDDVQAEQPADTRSVFARAYDAAFTPPEAVTRTAAQVANAIDVADRDGVAPAGGMLEQVAQIPGAVADVARNLITEPTATIRGGLAGAVEGAASLLTPGDAALTALGFGPLARIVRGVRGGAQVAEGAQQAANLATVARGGERALDAETLSEAAAGVAQGAIGAAGMRQRPQAAPTPAPERRALPAGARYVAAPDGRVAPAGTDIPMAQAPDGSFVRGVPAEYARREIAGLLPEGRRVLVTPPPEGSVPRVPTAEDAAVGSVRATVADWEIDPYVPARQGVRPRQFSGDPGAADAPFVTPEQRRVLEVMREDLYEFRPQRGSFVNGVYTEGGEGYYARGGPGSPVGDDIRIISGQHVGNVEMIAAIDELLAGNRPTNRLHTAAIDAAQGYIEGREGYRGPLLPMDAPEPVGAGAGAGAGVRPDDEGFDRFMAGFDDIEADPRGEPGEAGFILPELAQNVAGAVAGGSAGLASADEDDSTLNKAARAAGGAVLGAAAPSVLRGQRGARAAGPTLSPRVVADAVARVPRTGRQGDPIRDSLAGFEPFFEKFGSPVVRDGVAKVVRDNAGFAEQRRGTIPTRTLGTFANEVRVNVEKSLPKGTALTGEAVTAYARALQATTRKVEDLAARVNSPNASDADIAAFQAARAEQDVIAKSLVGARAEAGRALAAFNFWGGILDSGSINLIRDAVNPLRDEAARIAQGLAGLPNDPITRYRWLQTQNRATWGQQLRTYYLSNLLSGPLTHIRNGLGNLSNAVFDTATIPVAAGIDAARSAVTGAPRTVRLSELPHRAAGAVVGIEKGFHDALFALRHGIHPAALTRSLDAAALRGRLDLPAAELPGGGRNPLNYPFRALHAPDAFFRSMARESELDSILFNQARNEGRSGQALLDRVAELRASMSPEAVALRQQADEYASRSVFLEKPGDFTTRAVAWAESIPGIWLIVPFIKITSAIGRQGAQFSPFGFLMRAARQGEGRVRTMAQSRATAGTMAAGYLYWLAASGRLSGSGPSDPADRAALMESGWRPNSIRIGDRWYGYQTISPVNVPAAVVANSVEAWKERGSKPEEVTDVIAQTLARTANSFLDATFLSGVFDLAEALKEPETSAARLGGRTAANFLPASSLIRTVQRATDPVIRQPRTAREHAIAGVPGLSEQIEPRISRFGEPVTREGGPAQRVLDVFNSASVVEDPIAAELSRLGVKLSVPSASAAVPGGTSRPEETQLKQARGRAVRQVLERVINHPRYASLSDEEKTQAVERAIDRARDAASATVRRELAEKRVGTVYQHPQYGRVRLLGTMANGTIRVVRVLPDGSDGGRHFIVSASDLRDAVAEAANTPRPAAPVPQTRAQRNLKATAAGKFSGVLPGPISRAELETLLPDMGVTYDELRAEAERRGLTVTD